MPGFLKDGQAKKEKTAPVIFISTTLIDHSISNYFKALGERLSELGCRVIFISDGRKVRKENLQENPAKINWPSPRPTKLPDFLFLIKLIYKYKPVLIIGNFGAVNVMMIAGWIFRVPLRIAWRHTLTSQIGADNRKTPLINVILHFRKKWIYTLATHVICNTDKTRLDIIKHYAVDASKCAVHPYLIPDPAARLSNIKPVLGKVVCAGRLFPSKGQDVLIRAIPRLIKTDKKRSFVFVGDGPSRSEFENLAKSLDVYSFCTFMGNVPLHEAHQEMACAQVVVTPSRNEALGLVNVEAFALSRPVVASDVDGIQEVVRNNKDGFLVPPDNPEALAQKIDELLCSDAYPRFCSNAREQFVSKFSQLHNLKGHADWYLSLITLR